MIPYHPTPDSLRRTKNLVILVYALQALCWIMGGLPAIVGVVINYLKRDEVADTWLASHFRWQIRTFWMALAGTVLGYLLLIVLIGWVILGVTLIWTIYRVAKGWLAVNDERPLPV